TRTLRRRSGGRDPPTRAAQRARGTTCGASRCRTLSADCDAETGIAQASLRRKCRARNGIAISRRFLMPRATALALLPLVSLPVAAATFEVSPGDDVRAAIGRLEPGDELVLRGGTYSFNSRFNIRVVGEPDRPIVIRGKEGEDALIHMTTSSQNILEVQ